MTYRKKLIEVSLPLETINVASVRENYIYRGNPSSLHKWWAQRPLAAARAVIFSQMVDDPSEYVNELLADPVLHKKAEQVYKKQFKAWEERKVTFDKAQAAEMSSSAKIDPGKRPTLEGIAVGLERERLFHIINKLVQWENMNNEEVLQEARDEIWRSWQRICKQNADHPQAKELFNPEKLPTFHDPFAGGGTLPLEAQRLGLEAHASDLNPVAVLINKAMIEIPPIFAGMPPMNPEARKEQRLISREWKGAEGLAEDVRYYGKWICNEAEKRIGHLYPNVEITAEMAKERSDLKPYVGQKLTVIGWIWARTVKSPNPAFAHVDIPLASTFMLSTKVGKEIHVDPMIDNDGYRFTIKVGKPKDKASIKNGTKLARGANFRCLMSDTPIASEYIKAEGVAGRMGTRLMAVVADGDRGRVYLSPTKSIEEVAHRVQPDWLPDVPLPNDPRNFWTVQYGLSSFGDLFTTRQLLALSTLSELIQHAHEQAKSDAQTAGLTNNNKETTQSGRSAQAYADAIAVYLAFAIDKHAMYGNSLVTWYSKENRPSMLFTRQTLPMAWDFTEVNPFCDVGGSLSKSISIVCSALEGLPISGLNGFASQASATISKDLHQVVISTDPPYYDNISYADLSDFFYVWLRRSMKSYFPELFTTVSVPKAEELISSPYRHGNKNLAEKFFLDGMTEALKHISEQSNLAFPVTIYYAFKQTETLDDNNTVSTGWETFLEAVISAGFAITGTWPMRTERQGRMIGNEANALASSIVLVCRKRLDDGYATSRREFVGALKTELPIALAQLQASNIAPVDLAQAAIGPGIAIYTRYSKVLDAQGQPLTVRDALALINQTMDEALAEQEGDFDADTRWALVWFEQSGFAEGEYGVAETLSKAKDTAISGMVSAGILASGRGKVRLLKPAELPEDWDPTTDSRLTTWEMVHQLIRALEADGENAAAALVAKLGAQAETARELCYRLYTICERKKRTTEALSYNGLVQSWPELTRLAREGYQPGEAQPTLF